MYQVNDKVRDEDGNIGIIEEADDPHNIVVRYLPTEESLGGVGLYCVVEGCKLYTYLEIIKP